MNIGAGIGGVASGLVGLFGHGKSPAGAANNYYDQIPDATNPYYQPYTDAGKTQLDQVNKQYTDLQNNPGGKYNDIGKEFQNSPGFKAALEQALGGANNAAAAGGMAGSPQHEQQNMGIATDLENQDYYNWMNGATDFYKEGLHGGQTVSEQGQKSAKEQADLVAQIKAKQAQQAYEEQAGKNAGTGKAWGDIFGGIGKMFV